ncbi:MAG: hypothetical protein QM757_26505 [Paludibaculum sp.]
MTNRISLIKRDGMWACQFFGPMSALVVRLFGENIVPTPFTDTVDQREVLACIQERNPGVLVEVAAK